MRNLIKLLVLVLSFSNICYAESAVMLARVSLDQATKQIMKKGDKRVLGAQTEIINGREVHVIKVLTPDGRIQHYLIDAETGQIVG